MTAPRVYLLLLASTIVCAQSLSPQRIAEADLGATNNPLGLQLQGSLSWLKPFSGTDPHRPDRYIQGGGTLALTGAYPRVSLFAKIQPAPFATIRVQGDRFQYLGMNGALLSLANKDEAFGGPDIQRLKGQEESGHAERCMLQPSLQAKIGSIVLRHQATLAWYQFSGKGPWFFEYEFDTLFSASDRVQDHQTQVLWDASRSGTLVCGLAYGVTHARDAGLFRRRAGFMGYWESGRDLPRFGRLRAYLQVGRVLQDRNRQGQIYSEAAIGTSFTR